MLDHHMQRSIVYQLGFTASARFSELKPDGIENKLFTYHLKKTIAAGFVEKSEDGLYRLTPAGRRLGYQAVRSEQYLLNKAYSVLFLIVRRLDDGAWLLFTRNIHPLQGFTTFVVGTPVAGQTAIETARQDLAEKTGLQGSFRPLGGGFYHAYEHGQLESYTNFTLLVCEDGAGELTTNDPNGNYEWVPEPDFTSKQFLPNINTLVELYKKGEPFFHEEMLTLGL